METALSTPGFSPSFLLCCATLAPRSLPRDQRLPEQLALHKTRMLTWRGQVLFCTAMLFAAAAEAAVAPPRPLYEIADLSGGNGRAVQESQQHRGPAAWRRALLQGDKKRKPLPNFEIGVPAPPKRVFREWQQAMVRERLQEFSSATFVSPGHPRPGYVALCVIARDAHPDLLEWVSHHARLGVSKIYLWDHASDPPMESVIKNYIAEGLVEYRHFSQVDHPSGKPQLYAYDQCLQQYGARHTWMAFIDVDEFLMFRDPWPSVQSLPHFLASFDGPNAPPVAVSGLGVHWLIFGSSGHGSRPTAGVLRSYYRCLPLRHAQHALVKTIVRTACTVSAEGPHSFKHNCTLPVLQTDRSPIQGARSEEPVHTRLVLHHYATKSRDEFALKMIRGSAMKRQRGWEYFAFIDEWSTEFNFDGQMLWDAVTTFQHYPAVTKEQLKRYETEQHEDFWLKGADDPRYHEQLRQKEAAATQQQQQQQQQAAVQAAAQATAQGVAAQQEQQQAATQDTAAQVAEAQLQTAATQAQQQAAAIQAQQQVAAAQEQAAAVQMVEAQQQAAVAQQQQAAAAQMVEAQQQQAAAAQMVEAQQQQAAAAQMVEAQQQQAAAAQMVEAQQQAAAAAQMVEAQQQQAAAAQMVEAQQQAAAAQTAEAQQQHAAAQQQQQVAAAVAQQQTAATAAQQQQAAAITAQQQQQQQQQAGGAVQQQQAAADVAVQR